MTRGLLALLALTLVLAGCPAPPIDETPYDFDVMPYDATPADPSVHNASGPPSCAPEAVLDMNALARRDGTTLTMQVDTRNGRNDLRVECTVRDSREIVLRYKTPAVADHVVRAIRVSTVTAATVANASLGDGNPDPVPDPTAYDTVLSIRLDCAGRDVSCNNDAFFRNRAGQTVTTRRSVVYYVDTDPEQTFYLVVDGYDGAAGAVQVTLDEITALGVQGAPCIPVPVERAMDPTAPTDPFRCPNPGIRCLPSAAPDGTDLCVPTVALGQPCDHEAHFDVCLNYDAECAENPSVANETRCALAGTAPGAVCRDPQNPRGRCDPGLACNQPDTTGQDAEVVRAECVPVRQRGESCDPSPTGYINHCADGLTCCALAPDAGSETACLPPGAGCYTPHEM